MKTSTKLKKGEKIVINTELLEEYIAKSGKSYKHLANVLGISQQNFRLKRNGTLEFKVSEIKILCSELGITSLTEMKKIFNLM